MKHKFTCLAMLVWFIQPKLWAICATLIKGPIAIDVLQCSAVQPEQAFPSSDSKYNFIRDLPPANRNQFLDTYRGLLIRGKVARSLAIRTGLSSEKGALNGEKIFAFIQPQQLTCDAIRAKRIQAFLDEVCCEGGGEAPCLLGSSYMLKKAQILSDGAGKAANGTQNKPEIQTAYQQAQAFLDKQDFKSAISVLEKAKATRPLDLQGQYLLAHSYREADKCTTALPILEGIFQKMESNSNWSDDEVYVRGGTLLYARCLSMLNRAGEAVIVLQSFLVEPKKYKKEINESTNHPDFGYIRTDKQYIKYLDSIKRSMSKGE